MKNTKKNSVMKKILPSACMLAVSAAMLSTSTYAWFTMNKTVEVTNMQVQAKADKGLLINEVAAADSATWDALATTNQSAGIQLRATSTADTNTWYVGYSTAKNSAASATAGAKSANLADNAYYTLGTSAGYTTAVETVQAESAGVSAKQEVTWVDADQSTTYENGEGYYVKYTYYLKSSGDQINFSPTGAAKTLNIKDVAVTGNTGSADLDKALRVAIVVNGKAYIYAPLYDSAQTYYVNAAAAADATTTLTGEQVTAMSSIPAVTANGTPVYVYLYFEGEDPNLKTDNITSTLDNLTVSFKFALSDHAATVTDNGVTVSST